MRESTSTCGSGALTRRLGRSSPSAGSSSDHRCQSRGATRATVLLVVHPGHHLSCTAVAAKLNKGSVVQCCTLAVERVPWGCRAGSDAILRAEWGRCRGKMGRAGSPLSSAEQSAGPTLCWPWSSEVTPRWHHGLVALHWSRQHSGHTPGMFIPAWPCAVAAGNVGQLKAVRGC